jgi:hypothetical protein
VKAVINSFSRRASTHGLQIGVAVRRDLDVPIHGVAWDGDTEGFPTPRRLADGEPIAL